MDPLIEAIGKHRPKKNLTSPTTIKNIWETLGIDWFKAIRLAQLQFLQPLGVPPGTREMLHSLPARRSKISTSGGTVSKDWAAKAGKGGDGKGMGDDLCCLDGLEKMRSSDILKWIKIVTKNVSF